MAVFDASAGLRDQVHTFRAESVEFCERIRLVIAVLILRREGRIEFRHHVVFQLSHRLEFNPKFIPQGFAGLVQGKIR